MLHNHNGFKLTYIDCGRMIVYNDIYDALRKERYSEQLQLLPKRFIADVAEYLGDKKKLASQQGDLFSDEILKVQKQLENAHSIFKELMLLRKKKLLGLVFVASETGISKRDFENMMDFEKELFDKIIAGVEEGDRNLKMQLLNGNGSEENKENQLKTILFLEDIEALVGMDGNPIGPFRKNEIVNLSKQIADIFIGDKKAEAVIEEG